MYFNNLIIQFGYYGNRVGTSEGYDVTLPITYKTFCNQYVTSRAYDHEEHLSRILTISKTRHLDRIRICNNGWHTNYNGVTGDWLTIGY